MALDPRYVVDLSLENYFVDKDTGEPLANGTVEFYKDDDRNVPKIVYQLTGAPPNYTYTALPNPITLSGVGTIQNAGGDNVALYYFPYDSDESDANVELYYIVVKDEGGTVQFTREAWPASGSVDGSGGGGGGGTGLTGNYVNKLTNPQFASVNFDPTSSLVITFTGTNTKVVNIAPAWDLVITHTGSGTVTVTRTAIAGSQRFPTNPPYTLNLVATTNISQLRLRQRLLHNPDIWAPVVEGERGYIAGGAMLTDGTEATMYYTPSVGNEQQVFTANNQSGDSEYYTETVQLDVASNTDDADTGYVDISLQFPVTGSFSVSSVQVVHLESNVVNIPYDQTPVESLGGAGGGLPDSIDYIFYKPLKSYLVGWDFCLNPAQFLGRTIGAVATGANKSTYFWDQTIIFQSANSGISVAPTTGNYLQTTAAATTQFALIQYIDIPLITTMFTENLSVVVSAWTNQAAGLGGTVSLWYTTDASLPDISAGTYNSLVATLDANGKPATFNGNWTEIPRIGGDATFTLQDKSANQNPDHFPFNGWQGLNRSTNHSQTFFAIVVGLGSLTMGNYVRWRSISLTPGNSPTVPGVQTADEVLRECQRYYEKSFEPDTVPASNGGGDVAGNRGFYQFCQIVGAGVGQIAGTISYKVTKRAIANVTLYNPYAAGSQIYDAGNGGGVIGDWSGCIVDNNIESSFKVVGTTNGGSALGDSSNFHWTSDARLGIV